MLWKFGGQRFVCKLKQSIKPRQDGVQPGAVHIITRKPLQIEKLGPLVIDDVGDF